MQLHQQDVQRDERSWDGNHHGRNEKDKNKISARKLQPRKSISRHGRCNDDAKNHDCGIEKAIEKVTTNEGSWVIWSFSEDEKMENIHCRIITYNSSIINSARIINIVGAGYFLLANPTRIKRFACLFDLINILSGVEIGKAIRSIKISS